MFQNKLKQSLAGRFTTKNDLLVPYRIRNQGKILEKGQVKITGNPEGNPGRGSICTPTMKP